jgi:hypothetical protein
MTERNCYFEQLLRGEHPQSHDYRNPYRISHNEKSAVRDVMILLRNVQEDAQMAMATIRDIMRWHGGDTIRSQIRPQERDLLSLVEAIAGPEDCESDDA